MSKEQILSNLKLLHSAVLAQPESNFDLSNYEQESSCGTIFCSAGLAASLPEFQAQGMGWRPIMHLPDRYVVTVDEVDIDEPYEADAMFGYMAWDRCFSHANDSIFDDVHRQAIFDGTMSHKSLALWRLERQIEAVEQS